MNGSTFKADRRGVTPVVGIALLVAITILLASTVAVFALGLGNSEQRETAPTVAFEFDYDSEAGDDDVLDVIHKSGNTVDATNVYVIVTGASCDPSGSDPDGRFPATDFLSGTSEITAGTSISIDGTSSLSCGAGNHLDLRSATVRLVWDTGTGASTTFRTWNGPG